MTGGDEVVDQIFKANGIYLAACCAMIEDKKPVIGVQGIKADVIAEAHLLEQ